MADLSAFPAKSIGLWQPDMGEYPVGELARHFVDRGGPIVKGRDERKDSRSGIGSAVQVADVDLVERDLADAKHQRALLFKGNIGGTLD